MSSKFSANPNSLKRTSRNFEKCLERRNSLFCLKRLVTLGKTNALGGAYFSEFFEWCGEAREEMLAKAGKLDGFSLHTSEAHMKFFRELLPFDEFEIVVWPRSNRMSLSLRFFFIRNQELVAIGDQEICLKRNDQLIPIPKPMVGFICQYDPE